MKSHANQISPASGNASKLSAATPVAELVAQVFETAPPEFRVTLLEQLLKPLGVLALLAIADGVFARIRFGGGWPSMIIRFEDAQRVQAKDVVALVARLQQVSVESLEGIAKTLAGAPHLGGAAAAALALTLLVQRAQARRSSD